MKLLIFALTIVPGAYWFGRAWAWAFWKLFGD
jgi:hypothetical protein